MPAFNTMPDWPIWDALPRIHFLILAVAMIGAALGVVGLRNLIHAALCLFVVFGCTAGYFILLNAEFLAFAQVLIYMGGISILILFAIMLSRKLVGWDVVMSNRQSIPAAIVCLLLAAMLIMPKPAGLISSIDWTEEPSLVITKEMLQNNPDVMRGWIEIGESATFFEDEEVAAAAEKREPRRSVSTTNWYAPNTAVLGQSLMSTYTLIFWVVSFLLTAAMIGALYIARKEDAVIVDPREEAPF
ncbi:MAG: NADH-quinone oxidoreductase subunit J [bacterium]